MVENGRRILTSLYFVEEKELVDTISELGYPEIAH